MLVDRSFGRWMTGFGDLGVGGDGDGGAAISERLAVPLATGGAERGRWDGEGEGDGWQRREAEGEGSQGRGRG